jgi:hypothetical protein
MLSEQEITDITHRADSLIADRTTWNNLFEDIRTYIYSTTASFTSRGPGDNAIDRNRQIFDPTAERAHSDLVGALMGGMTNNSIKWFNYGVMDERIMERLEVKRHLELSTLQVLNVFSSQTSNFYSSLHEFYFELTGFGTGFIFKRGKGSKSFFETVPLADVYFEENDYGQVDSVYRPMMMTPKQVMDQFKLSPTLLETIERQNASPSSVNKLEVLHAVIPRKSRNKSKNNSKNKKYASVYILKGVGTEDQLLEESGFDRFPYYSSRWEKVAGRESLGRGVGSKAIKAAKVINKMVKTNLEAGEQIVTPALDGPYNSYVGKVNLTPRAINWRKITIGGTDTGLRPINTVGNLPIGLEMENQWRRAINEIFFIDLLQENKQARMTQMETALNQQERLMKMAPQLFRFQTEFLNRLTMDMYEELSEEGIIPEPPTELEDITIVYNSPLVMAQKQAEIANITGFANTLSQYAQIFPDMLLLPKASQLGRTIAAVFNISAKDLNTEEEINNEKQRQQQIAENTAKAEQAKAISEAGLNIAKVQSQGVDPASIF